jgi:hypothetical protein
VSGFKVVPSSRDAIYLFMICHEVENMSVTISAYFNQTSVTLHPVVVYHKGAEGDLLHRSFIIVSDEMAHKAGTVITFVKEL